MIVGLGNIGMGYDFNIKSSKIVMTHCKAFSLHPNFNIVAGVDKDIKKKPLFEKRFKASFYTSIKIALKNYKPEIVVISVNTKDIDSNKKIELLFKKRSKEISTIGKEDKKNSSNFIEPHHIPREQLYSFFVLT